MRSGKDSGAAAAWLLRPRVPYSSCKEVRAGRQGNGEWWRRSKGGQANTVRVWLPGADHVTIAQSQQTPAGQYTQLSHLEVEVGRVDAAARLPGARAARRIHICGVRLQPVQHRSQAAQLACRGASMGRGRGECTLECNCPTSAGGVQDRFLLAQATACKAF